MMWRPNDPVEEEVSAPLGIAPQGKHGRSRRRNWRDGLADQTVLQPLDDFRSYRAFERALIGSVDPPSALELVLVHRLANLLWRLRRACAIETGLFEMQGAKFGPPAGKSRPVDSLNPARPKLRPGPMDIAKALMRTDVTMCWSVTRNRCEPPLPAALGLTVAPGDANNIDS